ncbi:hypothetical protein VUR80DRAFT_6294 [Thermomyces stellatus]
MSCIPRRLFAWPRSRASHVAYLGKSVQKKKIRRKMASQSVLARFSGLPHPWWSARAWGSLSPQRPKRHNLTTESGAAQ